MTSSENTINSDIPNFLEEDTMVIPGNGEYPEEIFIFDERTLYKNKLSYLIKHIPEMGFSPAEFEDYMKTKDKTNRKKII